MLQTAECRFGVGHETFHCLDISQHQLGSVCPPAYLRKSIDHVQPTVQIGLQMTAAHVKSLEFLTNVFEFITTLPNANLYS